MTSILHRCVLFVAVLLAFSPVRADEETGYSWPLGPIGGKFRIWTGESYIRVSEVTSSAPGAAAGLQVGDFITGAFGQSFDPIGGSKFDGVVRELSAAIDHAELNNLPLPLSIIRPGGGGLTLNIIASVSGWTDKRQWNKYSSQQAAVINLTAGQPYYLQGLHKEGGGGDNLSIGWTTPANSSVTVIGAEYTARAYTEIAPTIVIQPSTFSTALGSPLTSTLGVTGGSLPDASTEPPLAVADALIAAGTPSGTIDVVANVFTVSVTDSIVAVQATLNISVIAVDTDTNDKAIHDKWELDRFGESSAGSNPATGDPDGDGFNNLMEYALESHPLSANKTPIISGFVELPSGSHLRLTVSKNPLATNLDYIVETCGALNDWSAVNTTIESDSNLQMIVRDNFSSSTDSRRFIRLRVVVKPQP